MAFTRVGQNISSQFGMPLYGIAGIPPFTGNQFWVNEASGSDGSTGGPQDPFATLTQALSQCTANNDDVVFLVGTVHLTATLTWSKNRTHLIGLTSAANVGSALISVSSVAATSGAFSPLVSVTGAGCIFQNISTLSGINQAATQVNWAEAGGKNFYQGCSFNQVGHATAAAQAGNRALTIASLSNTFVDCNIGGDQVIRATGTNFTVDLLAGAGSTTFQACTFAMFSSAAADAHINAATTTLTGYILLDNCQLIQDIENATATSLNAAIIANASAGGAILLTPTTISLGATAIATTGPVYIVGVSPTGTTSSATVGIAVKAT